MLNKEQGADFVLKIILFIISPFISFLYSLRRMKTRSSLVVFFLFALFFGMAFTTSVGKDEENRTDSAVFQALFENEIVYYSFNDYITAIVDIISGNSWHKDIYFYSCAFIVSRFTYNSHYLWLFFAFIFGGFMILSLKMLVENINFRNNWYFLLIASMFTMNAISNINGMRFWTAAWIGCYALLKILTEDKYLYYILLLVTPLVHSSYYFLLVIVGIYLLYSLRQKTHIETSKRLTLLYVAIAISFISGTVIGSLIQNNAILSRFLVYSDSENVLGYQYKGIIRILFDIISFIYVNLMFILIHKKYKQGFEIKSKSLFNFVYIYLIVIDFVFLIPSLGARFFMFGFPLIAYLWLSEYGDKQYRWVIYIMPLTMLWYYHNNYLLMTFFVDKLFYIQPPFYLINKYLIQSVI